MFAYGNNNPIRYVDPTGRDVDNLLSTNQSIQQEKKYETPTEVKILDNGSSIASPAVGFKLSKLITAYNKATGPILTTKHNELNMASGIICGFRNPNSVYALELSSKIKTVSRTSATLTYLGIGVALFDSFACGISQHSLKAGLLRAARWTLVIGGTALVSSIFSGLGPLSGILGFAAGKGIDNFLQKKGW